MKISCMRSFSGRFSGFIEFVTVGLAFFCAGSANATDVRRLVGNESLHSSDIGTRANNTLGVSDNRTESPVNNPLGVDLFLDGSIVIADTDNNRILRYINGSTYLLAASREETNHLITKDSKFIKISLKSPSSVAVGPDQSLYIADTGHSQVVRIVDRQSFVLAGPEDGLDRPQGIAVAKDGSVLVADAGRNQVLRISVDSQISVLAGVGTSEGEIETDEPKKIKLNRPHDVSITSDGLVAIADSGHHRLLWINAAGKVSVLAGMTYKSGNAIASDGDPKKSLFNTPTAVHVFKSGTRLIIVIADTCNHQIKLIDADGKLRVLAGDGNVARKIDAPLKTCFRFPRGVTVSPDGESVLVADTFNNQILLIPIYSYGLARKEGIGNGLNSTSKLLSLKINEPSKISLNAKAARALPMSLSNCVVTQDEKGQHQNIKPSGIAKSPVQ